MGKKRRYGQRYDVWGVKDEWENETQPKDKKTSLLKNATKYKEHDMLRMMEHGIDLSMT